MGFSRQQYWSVLLFPTPGDIPDPGMEPMSPVSLSLAGGFFTTGKPSWAWQVGSLPLGSPPGLRQSCYSDETGIKL